MKLCKIGVFLGLFLLFLTVFSRNSFALYDPLSRPNNMFGIHILFPQELDDASKLVNSSNGEWGYVTIPIQMGDYDLDKWQDFMDQAREKKLIPIIRLMTDPYWANTNVWRKPNEYDIIDMANFLNSLNWPTENRYVIVFNEMNRFDEWGGSFPDPHEYSDLLNYTIDIFKERSKDFFIIMGGLDNAAPNDGVKYESNYAYLESMIGYNTEVFKKLDGFSSHSYPNPGFSQPPSDSERMGVATYRYEYDMISQAAGKKVPVFITETGWDAHIVSQDTIAKYYKETFENIWGKDSDKIVAVTPFLLRSHGGFDQFSFFINDTQSKYYHVIHDLPKIAGKPIMTQYSPKILSESTIVKGISNIDPTRPPAQPILPEFVTDYFKEILDMTE